MPRRIVIHAGFHKTGTTTIQQTLRLNRPLLRGLVRSIMKPGMKDVANAARGFSGSGDALARAKFHSRFGALLVEQPPMPRRVLCLSAEELSGHLPGRPGIATYSAAIKLARDMADCAKMVFPQAELVFLYTTRTPEDWLRSAYAEHVKSSSLTMDFQDFAKAFPKAADLDAIINEITSAVSARVLRSKLSDTAGSDFGPATRILDLCEIPQELRAQMTRPDPANRRPDPAMLAALLEANRTISDKTALKAAKETILHGKRTQPG